MNLEVVSIGLESSDPETASVCRSEKLARMHGAASLVYSVLTGMRLLQQKAKRSGKFGAWLKSTQIPEKWARGYMRAARGLADSGKLDAIVESGILDEDLCRLNEQQEKQLLHSLSGIITARTFSELLQTLGLLPQIGTNAGDETLKGNGDPDPWVEQRLAFAMVGKPIIDLSHAALNPEKFDQAIWTLPAEDVLNEDGSTVLIGAINLESELKKVLSRMVQIRKAKSKSVPA